MIPAAVRFALLLASASESSVWTSMDQSRAPSQVLCETAVSTDFRCLGGDWPGLHPGTRNGFQASSSSLEKHDTHFSRLMPLQLPVGAVYHSPSRVVDLCRSMSYAVHGVYDMLIDKVVSSPGTVRLLEPNRSINPRLDHIQIETCAITTILIPCRPLRVL